MDHLRIKYQKTNKCLADIKYDEFPKISYQKHNNIPYSEGPFISSPKIYYLQENKIFDSYGSGIDYFGIYKKSFCDIPAYRFVKIKIIDSNIFKITWVETDIDDKNDELLLDMLCETDYDWRVFDKLCFESKSKVIKIKFDFGDEIVEKPEQNVISS